MNSGLYGLGSSIQPNKIYFKSDEPNTKQQTNPLFPLYIYLSISSSSPSSSIPPTQTLLISLSFLPPSPVVPSPQKWHARQPAFLSLERAAPSSPPSPSCPMFLSETSDSSRFAEALMYIKSVMCIPPRLLQSIFTTPRWLQPLVVYFTTNRAERLRRDGQTAGERANCCHGNMLHGEFMRAGVCAAICCCSVTEVHRRATIFKTWRTSHGKVLESL